MEFDIANMLSTRPEVLLFFVIGIGYLIGKIKVKGFELGSAAGVLFAALVLGHLGKGSFAIPKIIETIGFIFFIYSVGFQSGPRFLASFKKDGVRYIVLSLIIAATGLALAWGLAAGFKLERGYAAGIMGGAMTSTPTLAAAQDAMDSGMAWMPKGLTGEELAQYKARINANITVGYAVTYIFGLVGLLLFVNLIPKLFRVDLTAEAEKLAKELKISEESDDDELGLADQGLPSVRMYTVTNTDLAGKSLDDIKFLQATDCVILKIKRGDRLLEPGVDTTLELNDRVALVGYVDNLGKAHELVGGDEVEDETLKEYTIETTQAVVRNNPMVGLTVRETGIVNEFSCYIDKLTRDGLNMPVSPDLKLEKGDHLVITGIKQNLQKVIERFGNAERPVHETDLLTFAFGIVAGIILGTVTVKIGSFPLGIGTAGGLLMTGLFIGHLRSRNPVFGRVPRAARFVLMEMGILFFLTGVGLRAGVGLAEGLRTAGIQLFLSGILITLIPGLVGFSVGFLVLKMNPVILLGAVTGAMTSTPALVTVNKAARSSLPALGYAGAYAFANIILTIVGQIMMML